jgi:5-oxoprolinase (ATP-hydrolysing)
VARLPNSGAYGDPFGRDPKLVLTDVLDGFTTLEFAERDGTAKIGGLAA